MLSGVNSARRQLGLGAAIAVVTGESIALGIFLTPATMAKSLGSPLLLASVWCGMALMALSGALCYSELAIRFPQSGGEYIYLREGFGETAAFLYGWMASIVMYPGVAAALAVGAAAYVTALLPLGRLLSLCVPAFLLLVFAGVNLLGTRLSGGMITGLNLLKLLVLFALVGWAFLSGHVHAANLLPLAARRSGSEALFPAIAAAVVSAFFSFGGWWEAGKIAGEIRDPEKNLPIAFIGGVLLVTAVYLLISFVFLTVAPLETSTSSIAFVAQFGQALFGSGGAKVLSFCVLLCVCGGLAALTMAAPHVSHAMANSGAFFSPLAKLHPRYGTPANAILLQTGLSLAALLLGTFDRILAYIIFSAVLFLAFTAATLFRLPGSFRLSRSLRAPGSVRRWWYPTAPLVFLVCSAAVAVLILLHDPIPALLGVGIVLCGLPLRRIFLRRTAAISLQADRV
jgi:APA family basic amino acid/polyamine antiporter